MLAGFLDDRHAPLGAFAEHGQLGLAEGLQLAHPPVPEVLVESFHELSGGLVADFPEAGDDGPGPGYLERPLQPQDPFAAGDRPKPVSQAESTARSTVPKLSEATSSAVRIPSSESDRTGELAPARASPESNPGCKAANPLPCQGALAGGVRPRPFSAAGLSSDDHSGGAKKPCVATCRNR